MTEGLPPNYKQLPTTDGVSARETEFYGARLIGVGLQPGTMVDLEAQRNSGALLVPDLSYLSMIPEGEKCPPEIQLSAISVAGKPGNRHGYFTYQGILGKNPVKYEGIAVSFEAGSGYPVKDDWQRRETNIIQMPPGRTTNVHVKLPEDVVTDITEKGSRVLVSEENYFQDETATCLVFDPVGPQSRAKFIIESAQPIHFAGPTERAVPAVRITLDGPFTNGNRRVLVPLAAFKDVLGVDPEGDTRKVGDALPPKITQLCYDIFNGTNGPAALFGGPMQVKQSKQ